MKLIINSFVITRLRDMQNLHDRNIASGTLTLYCFNEGLVLLSLVAVILILALQSIRIFFAHHCYVKLPTVVLLEADWECCEMLFV
jgi:hypothetical protein